jgi:hypothetical protein
MISSHMMTPNAYTSLHLCSWLFLRNSGAIWNGAPDVMPDAWPRCATRRARPKSVILAVAPLLISADTTSLWRTESNCTHPLPQVSTMLRSCILMLGVAMCCINTTRRNTMLAECVCKHHATTVLNRRWHLKEDVGGVEVSMKDVLAMHVCHTGAHMLQDGNDRIPALWKVTSAEIALVYRGSQAASIAVFLYKSSPFSVQQQC